MPHKQVLFLSAAPAKRFCGGYSAGGCSPRDARPRSKSLLIEKKWGAPIVCNDGVTIAEEFDLKDPEDNLGAANAAASCRKDRRHGRRPNEHRDHFGPCYLRGWHPQCGCRRERDRDQARTGSCDQASDRGALRALEAGGDAQGEGGGRRDRCTQWLRNR